MQRQNSQIFIGLISKDLTVTRKILSPWNLPNLIPSIQNCKQMINNNKIVKAENSVLLLMGFTLLKTPVHF